MIEEILACEEVNEGETAYPILSSSSAAKDEPRYLVREQGRSYTHLSWVTREVVTGGAGGGTARLAAFHKKSDAKKLEVQLSGYYFPAEWQVAERVIDRRGEGDATELMIKWTGLPYSMCTWEKPSDALVTKHLEGGEEGLQGLVKEWERREKPPTKKDVAKAAAQAKKLAKRKGCEKEDCGSVGSGSGYVSKARGYELRGYQREGIDWLIFSWANKRNVILADEMGLGKTVQAAVFMKYVLGKENARELRDWTDLNVVMLAGDAASRKRVLSMEWSHSKGSKAVKVDVLVTTYEVLHSELTTLRAASWSLLIVDEGHRIKNEKSQVARELGSLEVDQKVVLTGTYIQNNLGELWALFNFLEPGRFDRESWLDAEQSQNLAILGSIKHYILRRTKQDVTKELKPLVETIVFVELTPFQKRCYRAIYERNAALLLQGQATRDMPTLNNVQMELRKCCNHPFLTPGVEEAEASKAGLGSWVQDTGVLIKYSGKLVLIQKLLPKLRDEGRRVLMFSQFKAMLSIMEDVLISFDLPYERLDGDISGDKRQGAIDRFNAPDSDDPSSTQHRPFAFLLSTRAGGTGINLQTADTVILLDSDWNPQMDIQAQARCHRIGQTKEVRVYRLVTARSYEAEMFKRAGEKLGLGHAVNSCLEGQDRGDGSSKDKKKEVDQLLRKGAYHVFGSEDGDEDSAGQRFLEADVDTILANSSAVIKHAGGSDAKGQFSVACFVSKDAEEQVHIDVADEAFWEKTVGHVIVDQGPGEILGRGGRARSTPSRLNYTKPGKTQRQGDEDDFGTSESETEEDVEAADQGGEDSDGQGKRKRAKGGSEAGTPSAKKSKQHSVLTIKQWKKLEAALLRFGLGRWEEVRAAAEMSESDLSIDTVALCCAAIVDAACQGEDQQVLASLRSSLLHLASPKSTLGKDLPPPSQLERAVKAAEQGMPVADVMEVSEPLSTAVEACGVPLPEMPLLSPAAAERISRRGGKMLRRWQLLAALGEEMASENWAAHPISRGIPGAPGWHLNPDQDTFLLMGVHKYGWPVGNGEAGTAGFEQIRQDPSFDFFGRVLQEEAAAQKEAKALIDSCTSKESAGASGEAVSAPSASVGEPEADGEPCQEVSQSEKDAVIAFLEEEQKAEEVDLAAWPETKRLNERVRQLIQGRRLAVAKVLKKKLKQLTCVKRQKEEEERLKLRQLKLQEKAAEKAEKLERAEAIRRMKEAQRKRQVSAADCAAFFKAFVAGGPKFSAVGSWKEAYDWESFGAGLGKKGIVGRGAEQCIQMLEAICRSCNEVHSQPFLLNGLEPGAGTDAVASLCKKMEQWAEEDEDDSKPAKGKKAKATFVVSHVMSSQLSEIMRERDEVCRRLLGLEAAAVSTAGASAKASAPAIVLDGLPEWWGEACDQDLVKGIRSHGMGDNSFKAIWKDPALGFLKLGGQGGKPPKPAMLKKWLRVLGQAAGSM